MILDTPMDLKKERILVIKMKKWIKVGIRVMFICASACIAVANFPAFSWGLLASALFFSGNVAAFIVNFPTIYWKNGCPTCGSWKVKQFFDSGTHMECTKCGVIFFREKK